MYKGEAFSPSTTLLENVSAVDTIIGVDNVSVFPPAPNIATIWNDDGTTGEVIQYNAIISNALSGCIRGVEGTATEHTKGDNIARNFNNYDYSKLVSNIELLNTNKLDKDKLIGTTHSIYVSPTGSDTTGVGTLGNPYLTINFAIIKSKDYPLSTGGNIVIIIADGEYDENVVINNGGLTLRGSNTATSIINGKVSITNGMARIENLTVNLLISSSTGIYAGAGAFVGVDGCKINGQNTASGIGAWGSVIIVDDCEINNCKYAIESVYSGLLTSRECSGSGNTFSYRPYQGSIFSSGDSIEATTEVYSVDGFFAKNGKVVTMLSDFPTIADLIIPTSSWLTDGTYADYSYRARIAISVVSVNDSVDVNLDIPSVGIANESELSSAVVSFAGGFYLYSKAVPTANLSGTYTVLKGTIYANMGEILIETKEEGL